MLPALAAVSVPQSLSKIDALLNIVDAELRQSKIDVNYNCGFIHLKKHKWNGSRNY